MNRTAYNKDESYLQLSSSLLNGQIPRLPFFQHKIKLWKTLLAGRHSYPEYDIQALEFYLEVTEHNEANMLSKWG